MTQKVNISTTIGGFSFNGRHSSEFGVRQTPESRVLAPQKRRTLLDIPGRSTAVIVEDGGYNSRVESIKCSYVAQEGVNLQRQVRKIAGWLSGIGELRFDYEPEMKYMAFLSSSPPTVKMLEYATFDLEFTMNHPFAYEDPTAITITKSTEWSSELISVGGTVPTPVRIRIKNIGTVPIQHLTIFNTIIIP